MEEPKTLTITLPIPLANFVGMKLMNETQFKGLSEASMAQKFIDLLEAAANKIQDKEEKKA